jgi:hypothetical protein
LTGNISDAIMYSRGTVGILHFKKHGLADTLKFWKGVELEVFWIRMKEQSLQNQEIERKLICSNADFSFIKFCSPSYFLKT